MNLSNRQRDSDLTQSCVDFCNTGLVCLVCHKCVRYSSLRVQLKDDRYTQALWSDAPIIQMIQGDENQYYFCTENVEMELKQKDKKACDIPVGHNKYMASEKQEDARQSKQVLPQFSDIAFGRPECLDVNVCNSYFCSYSARSCAE